MTQQTALGSYTGNKVFWEFNIYISSPISKCFLASTTAVTFRWRWHAPSQAVSLHCSSTWRYNANRRWDTDWHCNGRGHNVLPPSLVTQPFPPHFSYKAQQDSKNFLQIKYFCISEGPLGIFQGALLFHPSPPCPASPILLCCITLLASPSF